VLRVNSDMVLLLLLSAIAEGGAVSGAVVRAVSGALRVR
jgi:hypothetical protein